MARTPRPHLSLRSADFSASSNGLQPADRRAPLRRHRLRLRCCCCLRRSVVLQKWAKLEEAVVPVVPVVPVALVVRQQPWCVSVASVQVPVQQAPLPVPLHRLWLLHHLHQLPLLQTQPSPPSASFSTPSLRTCLGPAGTSCSKAVHTLPHHLHCCCRLLQLLQLLRPLRRPQWEHLWKALVQRHWLSLPSAVAPHPPLSS